MSKEKKNLKKDIKQSKLGLLYLRTLEAKDNNKYIFAVTIEGPAYIYRVTPQGFEDFDVIKPEHPICATYFNPTKKYLYLGDIVGGITKYNFSNKRYQSKGYINESYKYQDRRNEPILHLFQYKNFIIAVNFSSEIKKIDFTQLKLLEAIQFQIRILKATSFEDQSQNCLVLAFENNYPPFIFTNLSKINFRDAQKFLYSFYKQDDIQANTVEVIYNEVAKCLVTLNRKSELCLYQVSSQTQRNTRTCEKLWCFKTSGVIIQNISIYQEYIVVIQPSQIQVIDLLKKKEVQHVKKLQKLKWGFLLDAHENQDGSKIHCKILISKGFNPFQPQQSKIAKPTLHLVTL